jgi:hypothetical protein
MMFPMLFQTMQGVKENTREDNEFSLRKTEWLETIATFKLLLIRHSMEAKLSNVVDRLTNPKVHVP